MADIAILVAEEYERRMKNSSKASAKEEKKWVSENFKIHNNVRLQDVEFIAKWVNLEPKTQIALAASAGFFSA